MLRKVCNACAYADVRNLAFGIGGGGAGNVYVRSHPHSAGIANDGVPGTWFAIDPAIANRYDGKGA